MKFKNFLLNRTDCPLDERNLVMAIAIVLISSLSNVALPQDEQLLFSGLVPEILDWGLYTCCSYLNWFSLVKEP